MKNCYLVILAWCATIFFNIGPAWAQAPTFAWAKQSVNSVSTNTQNLGRAVATDASGNIYVTGGFSNSTTFSGTTLVSSGGLDIFIAKYNASGVLQWIRKAGGTSSDQGAGIAVDASGNSYITGNFNGSATFGTTTLTTSGSNDIFIAKYDASGSLTWVQKYGGTSSDIGVGIAIDGNGNSYITGNFTSPSVAFGTTTLTSSNGGNKIYIAKFNASGNAVWARQAGTSSDYGYGIAVDGNGNCFITGYFYSASATFGTITIANANAATAPGSTPDIFLAKYNAFGTVQWVKQAGATDGDYGFGVAVDGSGNSYVTGSFAGNVSFGGVSLNSGTNSDAFIIKYDPSGNTLWAKKVGGNSNDGGYAITLDGAGNGYILGQYSSSTLTFGSNTLTNASSNTELFVGKFNTSGNELWAQEANGLVVQGYGISVDNAGNTYITGAFTYANTTFGNVTLTTSGQEMFVAKVNSDIGIQTGTLSSTSYCKGASVSVPFTVTGTFNSGNTFTAQLSNASGSFASPVSIGTLTGTTSGTISAAIPANTTAGTAYRIRVIASDPSTTGTDNGADLTITAAPSITASANTMPLCSGGTTRIAAYLGTANTATYCTPSGGTTALSAKLMVGNTFLNTDPATQAYKDFTQTLAPVVFKAATSSSSVSQVDFTFYLDAPTIYYSYGSLRIYLDLDQDGSFNGAEEMYNGQIPLYGAPSTFVNGSMYIPHSLNILTRMRVQVDFSGALNTCSGEMVLDYPVAINPAYTYAWTPTTGLSSASIANPTVSNVTSNTTYAVTVTDATTGCSSQASVPVNVTAVPAPVVTSGTINCSGTATLTASGGTTGSIYKWYTTPYVSTPVNTGDTFTTPVLNTTTNYWVANYTGSCVSTFTQTTVTVTPCTFTWTGTTSSDWHTAGNWSTGSLPTNTDDVNIPSGTTHSPVITSGTASAKDLTIASGATLTINGGALNVKEDFTNNGTFTATGGSALFSGATAQVIGGSNPSTFNDLTISAAGASLAGPVSVQHLLTLNGNLTTNSNTFTLLSNASGAAMVVNNGGVVNGTATMQRYIDPAQNAGLGYRHYSSPVSNTTVNDLATTGFTPKVNTAYNALPTPNLTLADFPNVFAYNESRVSGSYPGFGIGWESPAALSSALVPGKGYTVNLTASQTVDFGGTLNNGTVTLTNLNNGGLANSGWHLLGNPYPSPINWNNITKPTGMMDAVYAYRSSNTYGGSYASYVNGVGTLTGGIIPAMQAFFVRTTANVPGFSFTNAARLTTYDNPSFYRTNETRPLLQLSLTNAQNLKDEAFVYLETGATSGLDGAFDALEMPMGSVRIFTLAGTEALSINGLSPTSAHQQIPVVIEGAAGTYTLKAEQFLNLQGYEAKLEDKQLSSLQPLQLNSLYNFSHSGGQNNNRFVLYLNAKVTGMAKAEKGMGIEIFPNPNQGKFKLNLTGLNQLEAKMIITDLVGREIMQQDLKVINGNIETEIALPVNKGIYLLQLKTGKQVIVRKIVVE